MKAQIRAANLLEELSGQAEGAEVFEAHNYQLPVTFRGGAIESVKAVATAGRALRLIQDGRVGFSTTTDLADDTTIVRNALESAQFGDAARFQFPPTVRSQPVPCFDRNIEQLDEEQLMGQGEEIVARFQSYDPALQVEVSLTKEVEQLSLFNTAGLAIEDQRTSFSITIETTRTQGDDILIVYDAAVSRQKQAVDGLDLAEEIIRRLRWAENTVQVESKAMPVVFRGLGTLSLLMPLRAGLNGQRVYENVSPLGGKLGQRVFDSRFSLVDDGRLSFAALSAPYDDEGTPTAEKTLIEGGTIQQFLYDLKTAAQAGTMSTGNGFKAGGLFERGFQLPPTIAPATWTIPPGDRGLQQILEGLDEALLVEQVIGLGQGNILAGEFSNNVSVGFLVRKGEVVGRVKNTMIAGNIYDLLKDRLIALSDRAEWLYGMLHTPAIAVDGVGVASKG